MRIHWAIPIGVLLGLGSTSSHAQLFLGRIGGNCASVPATPTLLIPLGANASAGNTLIVSVAVSSNFVSGARVTDSVGNRYQAIGGVEDSLAGSVVHFRAALQRTLTAGQNLQLGFDNADAGVSACASVLAYSGIAFGGIIQETLGSSAGQSVIATIAASEPGSNTRKLVLAGLATHANPGAITPQAPASALPALCTGSQSLCLIDAQYFADPVGPSSVTLAVANAVG
jgi:hypothetical protein